MAQEAKETMRQRFENKLKSVNSKSNSVILSNVKILDLIKEVKEEKFKETGKSSRHYWLLQHYDVLNVEGRKKLILPISEANADIKYYCAMEDLFDVLYDSHSSIGHGGRNRMIYEINKKYKNITRNQIQLFLNLCEPCQQKKKGIKKGIVVKPIISHHFNSRCQIDLIDFQSQPDGEY
ncbi:KRAB-A domain-containing protein 2-like [Copidosoma floridanum]|uniref:KRAB-A domain-containing protein 2-like n=1 Tax=Copidosoma floridanum TaxID=29053 RepID=UPI0006C94B57|nr:KRAB-A domain-containing protein 2-like [Copidosoma floridanum]